MAAAVQQGSAIKKYVERSRRRARTACIHHNGFARPIDTGLGIDSRDDCMCVCGGRP